MRTAAERSARCIGGTAVALFLAFTAMLGNRVSAHAIDYLAASISPASTFNGASKNFTVTNPVTAGSAITFNLTFSIVSQGNTTTFPKTITFGSDTEAQPIGAPDVVVKNANNLTSWSHTFTSASSSFTDAITITAPTTPGSYTVKIQPTAGTGGSGGLSAGGGISISFIVGVTAPTAQDTTLEILGGSTCGISIVYGQPTVTLSAKLLVGANPLSGRQIDFTLGTNTLGSAITDVDGIATVEADLAGLNLGVGDYTIVATFVGSSLYNGSTDNENVSVSYLFLGFQQPINADGSSTFSGRTVPVKVKLTDYFGNVVPDASAHVFFAVGTPAVVGSDAEPVANTNGDSGNAMRFDPNAGQYVFNWDVEGFGVGNYTVRVGLDEGACSTPHTVVLSLKRNRGGK